MNEELDKTIPPQRPAGNDFDVDKTIPPQRTGANMPDMEKTMPGHHDRKTDGRFAVGDLIMGRYKVLAELGQGGMGVVYKCFDETAGIEVALKALPPELSHNSLEMDDIKENFQLVHALFHPHIAASNNLERNPENGNYYLIMECCEGEDLRRWIKRKRKDNPLTLDDVLPVIKQVAEALDYAHAQKIIHRDIKPGNIMIDSAGNVKVLDFGLAAQIHTSMTRVSMAYHGTSGTGPYMAPEQWRGKKQGAASDQYALAVMTYEMLSGDLPFESTDPAVLKQAVLDEMPDEIPDLPADAQAALNRAMSKDAADRFNSCADFVSAMTGAKVGKAKKVSSGKSGGGAWKWIAAVIMLALIVAGAFFALNRTSATPTAPIPADTAADAEARAKAAEQKAAEAEARAKAAEQKAAEQKAAEQKAAEQKAAEQKAAEQKAAEQKAAEQKAAEEARKAEDVQGDREQTRQVAALLQEVYRLQARVKNKKDEIELVRYDRGQTFGGWLDSLQENYTAGELALKNNDVSTAKSSFEKADQAADWLRTNGPKREEVKALREQVQEQQKKADGFEGSKLAYVSYKEAEGFVKTADQSYNVGNFPAALDALKSARSSYEKAYQEARKQTVDNFVAAARTAKGGGNWQRVKDQAEAALKIDSANREALALKNEAETHLVPTLEFQFTCNGEAFTMTPEVTALKTKPQKNGTLERGKEYEFSFLYREGSFFYRGKTAFTCDWFGPRQIEVALTKFDYVTEAERQGLRLSGDKKTVIGVKSKDITSCEIPYGITSIGWVAFSNCKNLTSVTIGNSVTSIGESAFRGCKKLTSITIPDSVTSIGDGAFSGCTSLTGITIGNSVISIGNSAFSDCTSLESITIPDSVTSIGDNAFLRVQSVQVSAGNPVFFVDGRGVLINKKEKSLLYAPPSLSSYTIPDSVTSIGAWAFEGCKNLTSITIPDSVTSIGYGAFSGCKNLTSIALGNSVTSIGEYAFDSCENLTSITIPDSVTSIGSWAFSRCTALTSITIPRHFTHYVNVPSGCKIIRREAAEKVARARAQALAEYRKGLQGVDNSGVDDIRADSKDREYLGKLKAFVEPKFRQPSDAQLNGRKPHTVVSVSIAADGRVLDWQITQASGIAAMDDAVRSTMRSLKVVPAPPRAMKIPLSFQAK